MPIHNGVVALLRGSASRNQPLSFRPYYVHYCEEKDTLVDSGHTFSVTRLYSSLRATRGQWRAEA